MMADILLAVVAVFTGISASLLFYGAGFVRGYGRGREEERKVLTFFQRRASHARPGLN